MYDLYSHDVLVDREAVGDDFALLFEAVADAFRGMSIGRIHTHWSSLRTKGC